MMHVIGNHDFDQKFAAFSHTGNKKKYAEHEYESFFGPTDYSLNIGDIHIICMKDIDYLGNKKYNTRFLKEQLAKKRFELCKTRKYSIFKCACSSI